MMIEGVPFQQFVIDHLKQFDKEQAKDPILLNIITTLRSDNNPHLKLYYRIFNRVLFRRTNLQNYFWKLCIPEHLINKIIWFTHLTFGHSGSKRTFHKLQETSYFDNMSRRVRNVLKICKQCQWHKPPTITMQTQFHSILPETINQTLATDIYGPLIISENGNRYVLVVVDLFSKFVKVVPLRYVTAKTVSNAFQNQILPHFPKADSIISDNGPQYNSKIWKDMLRVNNIKPIFISKYRPQSNPAERIMRELSRFLRTYSYQKQKTWDNHLKNFEDTTNHLLHSSTGYTPVELQCNNLPDNIFWQYIAFPEDTEFQTHERKLRIARKNLRIASERRNKNHNRKYPLRQFYVGQKVLLRNKKLSNRGPQGCAKLYRYFVGPLRIKKIKHNNAVELCSLNRKRSFGLRHVADIKPFYD
jgi:Integrase core domain.